VRERIQVAEVLRGVRPRLRVVLRARLVTGERALEGVRPRRRAHEGDAIALVFRCTDDPIRVTRIELQELGNALLRFRVELLVSGARDLHVTEVVPRLGFAADEQTGRREPRGCSTPHEVEHAGRSIMARRRAARQARAKNVGFC
jgi:hypothetical protein